MSSLWMKWYLRKLKSHPYMANMSSACILMTMGDLAAQVIEMETITTTPPPTTTAQNQQQQQQQQQRGNDPVQRNHPHSHLHNNIGIDTNPLQLQRQFTILQQHGPADAVVSHSSKNHNNNDDDDNGHEEDVRIISTSSQYSSSSWLLLMQLQDMFVSANHSLLTSLSRFHDTIFRIDGTRSFAMGCFAFFINSPYWVTIFRWYERSLPVGGTVLGVTSRVTSTFLFAIPINTAFFCYGCFVHHLSNWIWIAILRDNNNNNNNNNNSCLKQQQQHQQLEDSVLKNMTAVVSNPFPLFSSLPPFGWTKVLERIQTKLDAEWYYTMKSSTVWIPFNFFQFGVVPPHLRPVTQGSCGVAWNCFLSLAQHRRHSTGGGDRDRGGDGHEDNPST